MRSFVLLSALVTVFAASVLAAEANEGAFLNPWPGKHPSDLPAPSPTIPRSQVRGAVALAGSLPLVRLGYVIPSNRSARANAVAKMRAMIVDNQNWFRDQFDRHGFGTKTFRFETEPDRVTPKVHVVTVPETDAYLRADLWSRTITAATNAGLTAWTAGEVWLLVPEAHMQAADGSVTGGTALGASFGSGTNPGVAMMGSDALARWDDGMAWDDRAYHNLVIPEIGPFPLKQDVSFPWFEGTTISSVSSAVRGASAHELSHAFGLPHDFRNDNNAHGNLMGNGLRGFRGNFFPARYGTHHTRLSYAAALALNVSRYFNAEMGETVLPTLTVSTAGAVTIVDGRINIGFTASDASGLAAAWLTLGGDLVAELPLTGTSVTTQFSVAHFTVDVANSYSVAVFDRLGNRRSAATTITPMSGPNRAPQPFVKISSPVPLTGETIVLDASQSTDPESLSSLLKVEWDLDGNGTFDTAPTTTKTYSLALPLHGSRYIMARISDPAGVTSVSTPLALHAHCPPTTIEPTFALHWLSKLGFSYQLFSSENLASWSAAGFAPLRGNGGTLLQMVTPPVDMDAAFYRAIVSKATP